MKRIYRVIIIVPCSRPGLLATDSVVAGCVHMRSAAEIKIRCTIIEIFSIVIIITQPICFPDRNNGNNRNKRPGDPSIGSSTEPSLSSSSSIIIRRRW